MALQSMTGFAHLEGTEGTLQWTWELRSVNGRTLDLRIRLPAGYERMEPEVREAISGRFTRGNVQTTLSVSRNDKRVEATVNQDILDAVIGAASQLREKTECDPPTVDGLLNIRGVLEFNEPSVDEATSQQEHAAIMSGLVEAVAALEAMRAGEGEKIGIVVAGQIDGIQTLASKAEADPSTSTDAIASRLSAQVQALVGSAGELDEERLHTEAAILASKADIREEIDRLIAHVEACKDLLAEGGAVGRRLDFLAQEFNREANTICSKSNATSLTAIGLDLKVLIDQFREQIQNLE
jgi:uncharacterized protein (TIGR00255 family)